MASELAGAAEPGQRLSVALGRYETDEIFRTTAEQKNAPGGDAISRSRMLDPSMSTLITEYDKLLEEMRERMCFYQEQVSEMRLKFGQVTKENERLHAELKEAVEDHLESLSSMPLGTDIPGDEEIVRDHQEQLQLMKQEKEVAIELWLYYRSLSNSSSSARKVQLKHRFTWLKGKDQKDEVTRLQQLIQQLHTANEKMELSNQQFRETVAEQNVELEELRKQLRQAKIDVQAAAARLDEMNRLTQKLQGELERREEDVISAQQRERASDKRLHEMQSSIIQLETRLRVTVQDAEQLTREKAALEKQIQELQMKYADVEREKYEAVGKVQDCIQLLEEANLQRSQALFAEKQKEEDIRRMKDEMSQVAEDNAARIRKESFHFERFQEDTTEIFRALKMRIKMLDIVKKQYNVQISQLTEELSAVQMECGEKQSQIERAIREKRAVEEELEKVYRQDRGSESDSRKLEQLHQKYLLAEAAKCDLHLTLQTTQNKLKQLEMNYEEEKSRCQEVVSRLESTLASEREKGVFISEDRLKLQQENEQLQKEMEGLRKLASEAQRNAKIKISMMEHEYALKQSGYEAQLKEMEDTSHRSTAELRRLLLAQQKATIRWKEETKSLTETTEARITKLKGELSQQKLRSQELFCQLEMANEKATEDEKSMMEYRQYIKTLRRRLSKAEQRAATASQKLSLIMTQKRKASFLRDMENT